MLWSRWSRFGGVRRRETIRLMMCHSATVLLSILRGCRCINVRYDRNRHFGRCNFTVASICQRWSTRGCITAEIYRIDQRFIWSQHGCQQHIYMLDTQSIVLYHVHHVTAVYLVTVLCAVHMPKHHLPSSHINRDNASIRTLPAPCRACRLHILRMRPP